MNRRPVALFLLLSLCLAPKYSGGGGSSVSGNSSSSTSSKSFAPTKSTSPLPQTSTAKMAQAQSEQKSRDASVKIDGKIQPRNSDGTFKSTAERSSVSSRRSYVVHHYHYHDSYPDPLWTYVALQASQQDQARWIYYHQSTMDQARLNDLYAQNAGLRAQVAAMNGQPVDPNWNPPGYSPSLMVEETPVVHYSSQPSAPIHWGRVFSILIGITALAVGILILVQFFTWRSENADR